MLDWIRELWRDCCEGSQTLKELNIYMIPTGYGVFVFYENPKHTTQKEKTNEIEKSTLV